MNIALALLLSLSAHADDAAHAAAAETKPPPQLDVPLYDAPFNYERGGYTVPSMRQSVALSTDFYENMHSLIGGEQGPWDSSARFFGVIGFDALSYWLPFGSNWMRAEWPRAVMSKNEISSYDQTWTFPFFSDTIKVTNISDTDLARLKTDHPADFVHMSTAAFEARTAQNLLIEEHHFYDDVSTFDQFQLWVNALTNTVYLSVCGSEAADIAIQKMRVAEGADIGKRDYTGLDCTSWVYDLYRPNEPYSARGVHPSGVGINRYITHAQLGTREQDFLRRQQFLSLLNFADPFLYGMPGWDGKFFGQDFHWTANLAHTLTSFGYVVDARLFLRHEDDKYLLTFHNGMGNHFYPGVTAAWVEHPIGDGFALTTSGTIWAQPAGQLLAAPSDKLLLDLSALLLCAWTPATSTYLGVEAKTPGWVLGEPYLDGNFSVYTGFRTTLF